jgi:hypothetical protein
MVVLYVRSLFANFLNGLPSTQDQRAEGLRIAERVLAEATNEGERKRREWRLCPHCQQPFIIDQMNCGQPSSRVVEISTVPTTVATDAVRLSTLAPLVTTRWTKQ